MTENVWELDPTDRVRWVREQADEISSAKLVSLLRDARERGDREFGETILEAIFGRPSGDGSFEGGRCEGMIRAALWKCGIVDQHQVEEFRSRSYFRILQAITQDRPHKPLWEDNFGAALYGAVVEVQCWHIRERAKREREDQLDRSYDDALMARGPSMATVLDGQRGFELLAELDPPVSRAAFLHWVEGYKIESSDPDESTVATALHVSGRTVRTYLKKAKEHVRRKFYPEESLSSEEGSYVDS